MSDLAAYRRFYAEELEAICDLRSAALVNALASVPRERFLPAGPWTIRGEVDMQARPRQTPDADPRRVYHNVAVAIDPARLLFNGAPSVLVGAIDQLMLQPGERVLHLGTGLGYYTAIMAGCVGASGRVLGLEVDDALAAKARDNLAEDPWVEVRQGDGAAPFGESFDAVLINAGVTHPLPVWLDALAPHARMIVPITATMPQMKTLGKGSLVFLQKTDDPQRLTARATGFVAIYSAVGIRDDRINAQLGQAMAKMPFVPIKTLRLDEHDTQPSCWLHIDAMCFSLQ